MKGLVLRGNFKFEYFLKSPKCSSSENNLFQMNSKEKIIGVKKFDNQYGALVKPYPRIIVNYSYRNQSHVQISDLACSIFFIYSITLGKSTLKISMYTSSMIMLMNSNILILLGGSGEKSLPRKCNSDTFEHKRIFNR